MSANSGVNSVVADLNNDIETRMHDLNGRVVNPDMAERGIYIVMDADGSRKIFK